jgi:hypothetical protein
MRAAAAKQVYLVPHSIDPDPCGVCEEGEWKAEVLKVVADQDLRKDGRSGQREGGSWIATSPRNHRGTSTMRFARGRRAHLQTASEGAGSSVVQGRWVQNERVQREVCGRCCPMIESLSLNAKTWRRKLKYFWELGRMSYIFGRDNRTTYRTALWLCEAPVR